ncbi:hypothetical protein [Acidithiobacillus albertensis]|uniref:hypothetical protein n=1 Tax=Acidithiobacillus albertensis TaxID=119978 RepID=UPI00094AFF17|nr:hypothetical protein [Acidithiobacillus albertensis]
MQLAEMTEQLRVYRAVQQAGIPVPTVWIKKVAGVPFNRLGKILLRLEDSHSLFCVGEIAIPPSRREAVYGKHRSKLYTATEALLKGPTDEVMCKAPHVWASVLESAAREVTNGPLTAETRLLIGVLRNAAVDAQATGMLDFFEDWPFQAYCGLMGISSSWALRKLKQILGIGEQHE